MEGDGAAGSFSLAVMHSYSSHARGLVSRLGPLTIVHCELWREV